MRLLVVSNMWPGPLKPNFGIFVKQRAEAYRRLGVDVRVAANDDPRRGSIRTALKYGRLLIKSVVGALRSRPDLVEGHYLRPTAFHTWVAAKVARCPYVLYAHGSDIVESPGRLTGLIVQRAAEIHTNSPSSADRISSSFPGSPVEVIPPGVDLDLFEAGQPDPGVVVFAGDLVEHKGLDVLLRAMTRIDDAELRVIGDGPERSALESLVIELGLQDRVQWVGAVEHSELGDHLNRAWVVAVPSRRDALGQVAIEAMASHTPIVVSDVGGLASVPDERSGSVVEPGEPEALAEALRGWLGISQTERAEAGKRSRNRAAGYAVDEMARRSIDRYERITSADRPVNA
jgi:glycosyltransferase involved in cell wall biosynthesis